MENMTLTGPNEKPPYWNVLLLQCITSAISTFLSQLFTFFCNSYRSAFSVTYSITSGTRKSVSCCRSFLLIFSAFALSLKIRKDGIKQNDHLHSCTWKSLNPLTNSLSLLSLSLSLSLSFIYLSNQWFFFSLLHLVSWILTCSTTSVSESILDSKSFLDPISEFSLSDSFVNVCNFFCKDKYFLNIVYFFQILTIFDKTDVSVHLPMTYYYSL